MVNNNRYTKAVATHLSTKLHVSTSGYRCRCGQCRHQILVAARRSQIPARRLIAALAPEKAPVKERGARQHRPMTAAVAESATITKGRSRMTSSGALLVLLAS